MDAPIDDDVITTLRLEEMERLVRATIDRMATTDKRKAFSEIMLRIIENAQPTVDKKRSPMAVSIDPKSLFYIEEDVMTILKQAENLEKSEMSNK